MKRWPLYIFVIVNVGRFGLQTAKINVINFFNSVAELCICIQIPCYKDSLFFNMKYRPQYDCHNWNSNNGHICARAHIFAIHADVLRWNQRKCTPCAELSSVFLLTHASNACARTHTLTFVCLCSTQTRATGWPQLLVLVRTRTYSLRTDGRTQVLARTHTHSRVVL